MDAEKTIWITRKEQIQDASVGSLERALLTTDGSGKEIKQLALEELKKRIRIEIENERKS